MTLNKKLVLKISKADKAVLPEEAVIKASGRKGFDGNAAVIASGKAVWNMAYAGQKVLGDKVSKRVVVTKYEHSKGPIEEFEIIEAGHPSPLSGFSGDFSIFQ